MSEDRGGACFSGPRLPEVLRGLGETGCAQGTPGVHMQLRLGPRVSPDVALFL